MVSLETGLSGLDRVVDLNKKQIENKLKENIPNKLLVVAEAIRKKVNLKRIFALSKIDTWFLEQIKEIVDNENKIKFNNDVLHQSKLVNYFNGDYSKSKIEKDIDYFLRKIKKNKKYFFSKKDQIFLESLKSDGIIIESKYDDLYVIDNSEIPTDIQVMINNNEKGAALLRIAEVIGQDDLDRIDEDTIYFIISTLNQLNIGLLRNRILLKVLPLKV